MNKSIFYFLIISISLFTVSSCGDGDDDTDPDIVEEMPDEVDMISSTPMSAFDEFNSDAVTISFNGDEVMLESNGEANHTSPYQPTDSPLYIEPIIANPDQMSPGGIGPRGAVTMTVTTKPEIAAMSTATGLGAIGLAVTGVVISNQQEGPTGVLSGGVVEGLDYAGGHSGPTGYHYHFEALDVGEDADVLSIDDEKLVGIMADGFLLYGRRCNATNDYPTDLDDSGGHSSTTQHSDEEFYHYHIINEIFLGPNYLLFGVDYKGTPNRIR